MSYLCNRNRETKIANDKVPWMSGLVSGLQNRVRRFESARNLNHYFKSLESQVLKNENEKVIKTTTVVLVHN